MAPEAGTTPVAATLPSPATTATTATNGTAAGAADAVAGGAATPAPAAGPAPAATPAPAARLTLTLSRTDPAAEGTTGPPPVATVVGDDARRPRRPGRPGRTPPAAAPRAADAPPMPLAIATAGPAIPHADPLAGLTRAGGMTTPHELARELGHRVQMAVREGGRELLINLRPPDLGHLTIRVTMIEGVMQAQIIADRPEAARMLQQSLAHLGSSLGDLGYSLDSLDIAWSGNDPRDASSSSSDPQRRSAGEGSEADGSTAAATPSTHAVAGDPGRLDLLA